MSACAQVLDTLGHAPLPPALAAHVEGCPRCQAAVRVHAALVAPRTPAPGTHARARIHALARAELQAHPRPVHWAWEALGLAALSLAVGLGGAFMLRAMSPADAPPPATTAPWSVGLLLVLMVVGGSFLALAPGGRRMRVLALGLALPTALGVGLTGSGVSDGRPFLQAGLGCLSAEVLLSLLPLVTALWLLTRIATRPLRTAVAGLGASAVGLVALHAHCPVGTAEHLFTFHVLPWAGLAVVAVVVRRRLPSRSFAP
ncbi:MAG: NrsF family protein [Myxococcaceae bacterium]|nr:NrsF family protein [Myxococcaceae bacterium]MCI0670392.1 NrsF family protein [Myxococcaceae bacterium]